MRSLLPDHPTCAMPCTRIAYKALYLRAHWLRMPPLPLTRHLLHKAFISKSAHCAQLRRDAAAQSRAEVTALTRWHAGRVRQRTGALGSGVEAQHHPSAAGRVILAEQCRRFRGRDAEPSGHAAIHQFEYSVQGELMSLAGLGIQPIAQRHEARERRRRQQTGSRAAKASGIADQIPITREAIEALQRGEIELIAREHVVRRIRVVAHGVRRGVAGDGRAAQPFQCPYLDFMRIERDQTIESRAETREVFAGQAGDEIGVEMGPRLLPQPADIMLGLLVVLTAADARLHLWIEALDADLELQRAGRKADDERAQTLGQMVGYQLEMQK